MSVQEDNNHIQPWRQSNRFTLTLRGHWASIPSPAQTVSLSDYDPYESDNVAPQIREVASDGNYNTFYDSFYAPVDFQMTGIAFKLPQFLPKGVSYRIKFKINGSEIELVEIPEEEDHNQKNLTIDCSTLIYEDDFIELEVTFSGNTELLSFNENNMVFSIGGCMWYGMYKSIYADVSVTVATTEEITLTGNQVIDGVLLNTDDTVFVKNQTNASENGIYVVNASTWTRDLDYPNIASLDGVTIFVMYGETQNSYTSNIYTFDGDEITFPLIEWAEGDKWYKTNIHLQNRSGNETLTDRIFVDVVKCTHNFLLQGISMSMWTDPLMIATPLKEARYCFFIDVLINGKSILPIVGFELPISLDAFNNNFKEYNMEVFNDVEGYPIKFGDVISLKLYQKNPYARTNGKIIQAILYGCGPDCATLDSPILSVYEPCEDSPCEWKYQLTDKCDEAAAKEDRRNPTVITTTPSVPTDKDYVTVDGMFVTVNGQKIWI